MIRWTLYDPDTGVTRQFPLNPREGVLPQMEKNIAQQVTTAPDGNVLLFEGRDSAQTFPFSGVILTQFHYEFMLDWFKRRRQVRVTDELGNQFWVYLTKFTPKRKNRHSHPWAMDYDAEALIIDWTPAP